MSSDSYNFSKHTICGKDMMLYMKMYLYIHITNLKKIVLSTLL